MPDFRKHHIYRNPNPTFLYLVDIQNIYYNALGTRIVVPLQIAESISMPPRDEAFPALDINGIMHYLITTEMAAVPRSALSFERAATFGEIEKIPQAVDRVLDGY